MSNNIQFRGIVALGNSRNQAVQRYTLAAMGKGVSMYVDNGNAQAFVSNASADLENVFNPANGNMDLEKSDEALSEHLQFAAKAGDMHEAYHFECTAGCGTHVVFDNKDLVKNCPACATAIASDGSEDEQEEDEEEDFDLDDEDLEALDDDLEADDEELEEDETSLSSDDSDDDEADDSDDSEDDEIIEDEEEEDFADEDETDADEDLDDDLDADDEDDSMEDAPLVVTAASMKAAVSNFSRLAGERVRAGVALASGDSNAVTAQYRVCASAEGCGAHVIGEVALDTCPRGACGAPLSEPTEDEQTAIAAGTEASMSLIDEDDSADDLADNEDDTTEDEADTDDGSDEADDADDAEDDSDDADDSDDSADDETATASDVGDLGTQSDDTAADDTAEAGDEVEVDLLDQLPEDASIEDVDVAFAAAIAGSSAWTAYHKGRPIAVATAASIRPEHADLFHTARFGTATAAAAKIGGVKSVLKQMGYTGVKAQVLVPKHIETRVAALASDATAALNAEREQYNANLLSAIATAAIGISRGFFADKTNPLRDSLIQALASCNFRNPEVVVDNAMRPGFDAMMRQIMGTAQEILGKPQEVQESLARTVLEVNYQPKTDLTAVASSAAVGQSLDDRLSQVGIAATASAEDAVAAATSVAQRDHVATASGGDFDALMAKAMGNLGKRG